MKAILEFVLPEDTDEFKTCQNAQRFKSAFEDVWQNLFRPYYKHGYADSEMDELMEDEKCRKLFEHLEKLYQEINKELLDDF